MSRISPHDAQTDPFGIRAATARVMRETTWVTINEDAIRQVAASMASDWGEPPAWDDTLHFRGTPLETAGWVVVLDALNFCFWAQGDDPEFRWRVTWRGTTHNGYDALAAALHRAVVDDGYPIWEAAWLRDVSLNTVSHMLRGDDGCPPIPLLRERTGCLRDLGISRYHRGKQPADIAVDAKGSVERVVRLALRRYVRFEDIAVWQCLSGQTIRVPFFKRTQILGADLAGALAGTDLAISRDLGKLTAFADYKVPQVLRQLGTLRYHLQLADRIRRLERIPPGSAEEVSIRAATVQACDRLVTALADLGIMTTASELDWRLWTLGQRPKADTGPALRGDTEPYHRTVTTAY